jgi:hypothetical protein
VTAPPPDAARRAGTTAARNDTARIWAVLCCLLFFLEGLVFIPYIGLQNDELLFGGAIYPPWGVSHLIRFQGHTFPTMLLSYVGTLKAWLYRVLVFSLWPPSPWSVRLPALLIGVATLWIFSELVRRTTGPRTALLATALLAFDVTFVLTTCFDWGPVALQHLFLLSGVLAVFSFYRSGKRRYLFAAFFVFGLGLWDKALFAWSLAGLAAASAVTFPRATFSRLRPRNVLAAVAGLALGAAPLMLYNRDTGLETLHGNARWSTARLDFKTTVLRGSLEGSALFGYLVPEEPALTPGEPANPVESLSLALRDAVGHRRAGGLALAFIVAFALLPWLWNTRARQPMLFSLVFLAVVWLQMALSQNGGAGAHHAVLLWPFPHLFIAAALGQISRSIPRAGLAALAVVAALLCGSNFLVLNEHLAQVVEGGNTVLWTDAIDPLAARLRATPARHVYVMDWGMFDALRALSEGTLPLEHGPDVFLRDTEKKLPPAMLARPDALFLGHTEGNEVDTGTAARLDALAESAGLRKHVAKTIADRKGRPVFEVYRFLPR